MEQQKKEKEEREKKEKEEAEKREKQKYVKKKIVHVLNLSYILGCFVTVWYSVVLSHKLPV